MGGFYFVFLKMSVKTDVKMSKTPDLGFSF